MKAFIAGLLALFMAVSTPGLLSGSVQESAPKPEKPLLMPIRYFVYIIQENKTFDHYFGTFPGANGIPEGTKLAYSPGGPPAAEPFHLRTTAIANDLLHNWPAARTAWNEGKMDGFLWAEWPAALVYYWKGQIPEPDPKLVRPGPSSVLTPKSKKKREHETAGTERFERGQAGQAPVGSPPDWVLNTLGYYDWNEIPNYWEYARRYTLCDNFFSSIMGPSEPNHLYAVAAQSGGMVENPSPDLVEEDGVYTFPTMAELLRDSKIPWRFYDPGEDPKSPSLWNPLPGFRSFQRSAGLMKGLVPFAQFYQDLESDHFPQVCWIVPSDANSEHSPYDVSLGM